VTYRFEIDKDVRGEFRWSFKTPNNQAVAVSGEGYTSKQSCQHGIDLVKMHAAGASIDDKTLKAYAW
jgi:uncharacterized protein